MQNYNIDNDRAVVDLWETHTIGIDGMTCEQCVKRLTRGLKSVSGIKDVKVDLNDATATVTYDTTKTDIPAIHDAILAAGYKPTKEVPK
jgi:copper chaperone CopZ